MSKSFIHDSLKSFLLLIFLIISFSSNGLPIDGTLVSENQFESEMSGWQQSAPYEPEQPVRPPNSNQGDVRREEPRPAAPSTAKRKAPTTSAASVRQPSTNNTSSVVEDPMAKKCTDEGGTWINTDSADGNGCDRSKSTSNPVSSSFADSKCIVGEDATACQFKCGRACDRVSAEATVSGCGANNQDTYKYVCNQNEADCGPNLVRHHCPGLSNSVCVESGKYSDDQQPPECGSNNSTAANNETDALKTCNEAKKTVDEGCDLSKNKEVSQITQISKKFASELANTAAIACTGLGDIAGKASLALYGFEKICQTELADCTDKCSEKHEENATYLKSVKGTPAEESFKAALKANRVTCAKQAARTTPSDLDAQRTMQTQVSKQCDNLLAKLGMDCLSNPSGPGCSSLKVNPGDCKNNPAYTGNPVCMCITNPSACANLNGSGLANLPSAGGISEGDGGAAVGSGAGSGGSLLDKAGALFGLGGGESPEFGAGGAGASGVNNAAGRGGGGYGGGGDGLGGGGKGKAGSGKTVADTNINKGTVGGSANFGGSGGGYRDAKDKNGNSLPASAFDKNGKLRPDFSRFYPNMKYDPGRGLAGISGPDGITGPATNLFQKVNNQFRSQSNSLLP